MIKASIWHRNQQKSLSTYNISKWNRALLSTFFQGQCLSWEGKKTHPELEWHGLRTQPQINPLSQARNAIFSEDQRWLSDGSYARKWPSTRMFGKEKHRYGFYEVPEASVFLENDCKMLPNTEFSFRLSRIASSSSEMIWISLSFATLYSKFSLSRAVSLAKVSWKMGNSIFLSREPRI